MEKRVFIAIGLSMVILIGWPYFFGAKTEPVQQTATEQQAATVQKTDVQNKAEAKEVIETKKQDQATAVIKDKTNVTIKEEQVVLENDKVKIEFLNTAASIKQAFFKEYKDNNGSFIRLSSEDATNPIFSLSEFKNINFVVTQKTATKVVFSNLANKDEFLKVTYEIEEQNPYIVKMYVQNTVNNSSKDIKLSLTGKEVEANSDYGLADKAEARAHTFGFRFADNTTELQTFAKIDKPLMTYGKEAKWVALSDRYFTVSAVTPKAEKNSNFKFSKIAVTNNASTQSYGADFFVGVNAEDSLALNLFVGPKTVKELEKLDDNLPDINDYGMFTILAIPMLELMKWIFKVLPNYGIAILLLTLIVRAIMYPLQHKSIKSMKKLQELQPQMKKLQEKYKEDREKLNQEMMQFMKTHKVNPMGGCFPMLLQLPVFIALYSVLSNSVELYRAPFMLWIVDLSIKDPYYVLPIIMGVMMFIQQKITPNPSMDPAQAKIMMFMPIIFTFFMISLPSGLTLYIMFSTFLGIVQQEVTTKYIPAFKLKKQNQKGIAQ